jgi:membrane protease YdiL (CAAX protease family)
MPQHQLKFLSGFIILFFIYHFPEFFTALWVAAVFKISFLFIAFLLARWQGWNGLGGYGLSLHRLWWKNLLLGIFIGCAFWAIAEILSLLAGFENFISIKNIQAVLTSLPLALLMTFFPSIAEDLLTRGYLFGHFSKQIRPPVFIFFSAMVYVLNHIWRLHDDVSVLAYLFILGLSLAWALVYTKSLWLTLGLHWGGNILFALSENNLTTQAADKNAANWMLSASYCLMFLAIVSAKKIFSRTAEIAFKSR